MKQQDKLEEILSHVIEECGEVLFWAGKVQRFGWKSKHPKYGEEFPYEALLREVKDLRYQLDLLEDEVNENFKYTVENE